MKHGEELLIDKILWIRFANLPDSVKPTASFNVIAKYLNIPQHTVTLLMDKYQQQCKKPDESKNE